MAIRLTHMPGEAPPAGPRGNKFRAVRTPCAHGHTHASKAEARWCNAYTMMQRAGEIRKLEQQPRFFFVGPDGRQVKTEDGKAVRYTADFRFEERFAGGWREVVAEVKGGYRDKAWILRRAFFRHFYPDINLREVA